LNGENKGKCCNVYHLKKYKYLKKDTPDNKNNHKKDKNKHKKERENLDLYLDFD